ncbi:MAG: YegS/Rv2252/BmrU family lipid kinase [Propionibacteriales bacterium]|nr:YegS/Rv2252/BmrU family lipid kinase [Propionibacteriales bacterium]
MATELALLVNPTSGRRMGARAAREAATVLRGHGHLVRELVGEDAGEAAYLAAMALRQGIDGLVVVGGDGMVHLAVQLLAGTDVPLGVVPVGSGNDMARTLGVPRHNVRAAAELVAAGRTRAMDLGGAAGTYFATVLACGFDSKVNERVNAMQWPRGQMRYNLATVAELRTFEPIGFTLELDGVRREEEAMLVAVGNGPTYGGGLRICEGAEIDDGVLDVVIIKPVPKIELVRTYPKLFRGTHVHHPQYERIRVSQVSLAAAGISAYADGEVFGALPLTLDVAPGALRVFAPGTGRHSLDI